MLLTPTSDHTTPRVSQEEPVPGATMVLEADSAEAALAAVHERLGPTARIVEARRMRRGGVGGFFAREVVQMHAAPGDEEPVGRAEVGTVPDHSDRPPATAPSSGAGARPAGEDAAGHTPPASPIDRVLAEADHADEVIDFATFLRQQLGGEAPAPATTATTGAEPAAAPSVAAPTLSAEADHRPVTEPSGGPRPADRLAVEPEGGEDGGPCWSVTTLIRLGLPSSLVRGLEVGGDGDDIAWTSALAAALRPLCRPLPTGRALLVGPCARGLAGRIGMPVARVGDAVRGPGDVAAAVGGGSAGLAWMRRSQRGRWLHLVAGGKGWRVLLHEDPLAISWADAEDLPEAVRYAFELGLVLGHGPLPGGTGRARPLEVALAIRDLVPRP